MNISQDLFTGFLVGGIAAYTVIQRILKRQTSYGLDSIIPVVKQYNEAVRNAQRAMEIHGMVPNSGPLEKTSGLEGFSAAEGDPGSGTYL